MTDRTIIIGDVHGCHEELRELLDKLNYRDDDHIIFLGDLIHRGPDSGRVLEIVEKLRRTHRVDIIEGNHEEKHRRWRMAVADGRVDCMRHVDHYSAAEEQMKAARVDGRSMEGYLDNDGWRPTPLPLYIRLIKHNAIVVHAGIMPSHDLPEKSPDLSALSNKQRKEFLKVLRVRHISPAGKMVRLGDRTPHDKYWAHLYDGRYGRAFFGHEPVRLAANPRRHDYRHAIGLDWGCVFGGSLAATVLTGLAYEIVSVGAQRRYSDQYVEE